MAVDSSDEVASLWQALHASQATEARERLIIRYSPFARAVASRLYGTRSDDSTPFDDYLQYARVGLIEALDRYDAELGASFETFSSYRIRGAILSGLTRETEVRAQRNHWRERTAERGESLVSGAFENPESVTLDEFVQLAVGLAIGLMLEDPASSPYGATELAQLRARARALVEELPPREREVMRRHYYEGQEFQEVAGVLKVTKGRVSQLHSRALERLRIGMDAKPKLDKQL
jgi:RNA polymerase sigma factor FliA